MWKELKKAENEPQQQTSNAQQQQQQLSSQDRVDQVNTTLYSFFSIYLFIFFYFVFYKLLIFHFQKY